MALTPRSQRLPCAAVPAVTSSALVREDEPALGGFGDDAGVGVVGRDERVGADAGVLFVDDQREHHAAAEIGVAQRHCGGHGGGDPAFHVVASAAVDAIAIDARLERRDRHPLRAHRVGVSAEGQGGPVAITHFRHRVGAAGCRLFQPSVHAPLFQPVAGELGEGGFAVAFIGHEHRVHRRDADEVAEQLEDRLAR